MRDISKGTSILTATHTIFRGVQLDLLQEEVRELRLQLRQLQDKEDEEVPGLHWSVVIGR